MRGRGPLRPERTGCWPPCALQVTPGHDNDHDTLLRDLGIACAEMNFAASPTTSPQDTLLQTDHTPQMPAYMSFLQMSKDVAADRHADTHLNRSYRMTTWL